MQADSGEPGVEEILIPKAMNLLKVGDWIKQFSAMEKKKKGFNALQCLHAATLGHSSVLPFRGQAICKRPTSSGQESYSFLQSYYEQKRSVPSQHFVNERLFSLNQEEEQ